MRVFGLLWFNVLFFNYFQFILNFFFGKSLLETIHVRLIFFPKNVYDIINFSRYHLPVYIRCTS